MRFFIFLLLLTVYNLSAQIPSRPEPAKYINDYVDILTTGEERDLEQKLYQNFKASSNQVVFVLLDAISYDITIEAFSQELFEKWGIGSKENNNGILIVVVMQSRQIRIQTGYGMEALVPDILAAQLIAQHLTPNFREYEYAKGIDALTTALIQITEGTYAPLPDPNSNRWYLYLIISFASIFLILVPFKALEINLRAPAELFAVLFVLTVGGGFINFAILADDGVGLGRIILNNFYWYLYAVLGLVSLVICIRYSRLYRFKYSIRLLFPLLFFGALFWGLILVKTGGNISLDFIFWTIHLVIWVLCFISKEQERGFIIDDKYRSILSEKLVTTFYKKASVESKVNEVKQGYDGIPFFLPDFLQKKLNQLKDLFNNPDKHFESRLDYKLIEIEGGLQQETSFLAAKHRLSLENRLATALKNYEPYAEDEAFPVKVGVEYQEDLDYFDEILGTKYKNLYEAAVVQIDLSTWEQESLEYQRPEEILKLRSEWRLEFIQDKTIESYKELELLLVKQKAEIIKLRKTYAKRNDIIIAPLIEKVRAAYLPNLEYYDEAARLALEKLLVEDTSFFTKYASMPLDEDGQKRLTQQITYYKTLLEDPKAILGLNVEFLKAQFEESINWDWTQYVGLYTSDSIENTKVIFSEAQQIVITDNYSSEALYNYYKNFRTPAPFLKSIVTKTYKSSSSYTISDDS